MIKVNSWEYVATHPDRWIEAIQYFAYPLKNIEGAGDRPDPRDKSAIFPLGAIPVDLPRKVSHVTTVKKIGWHPTKQSHNSCTSYSKGHGVEIVNTLEHGKPIYIDKEKQWGYQELLGASRDSGDTIQNAEYCFHENPQGFPQTEYRRMRRGENTVYGAKLWLAHGDTIRTGVYWRWCPEEHNTNSGLMIKYGFFVKGSGLPTGGHAVDMVGYDEDKVNPMTGEVGAFEMLESELINWGDNDPGTFWVSYSDFGSLFSKYISKDTWDV